MVYAQKFILCPKKNVNANVKVLNAVKKRHVSVALKSVAAKINT